MEAVLWVGRPPGWSNVGDLGSRVIVMVRDRTSAPNIMETAVPPPGAAPTYNHEFRPRPAWFLPNLCASMVVGNLHCEVPST